MSNQSELVSSNGGTIAAGGTLTTNGDFAGVTDESAFFELNAGGTITSEASLSVVDPSNVTAGNDQIAFVDATHMVTGRQIGPQEFLEVHGPAAHEKESLSSTL